MTLARKERAETVAVSGFQRVPILGSTDIVTARQMGRTMASQLRFTSGELTLIATAISEVARNIVEYAGQGEVDLEIIRQRSRSGLRVIARDLGPGIPDVSRALQVGFSTGKGLGLGLPGVRRLMDDFTLTSAVGRGTTVTMYKWAP